MTLVASMLAGSDTPYTLENSIVSFLGTWNAVFPV